MRVTLLAAITLTACASGPAPIAMSDFCDRETARLCEMVGICGCAITMPDCLTTSRAQCADVVGSPELVAAIENGTVVWDAAMAGVVLERSYSDGLNCWSVERPHGVTADQRGTLNGILRGTLPVGAACTGTLTTAAIEPCADGRCIAGHCRVLADIGQPCDADVVCVDRARPLTFAPPDVTASCQAGVCVREGAWPGSACDADSECASGTCSTFCRGLTTGMPCTSHAACETGACQGTCVDVMVGTPCSAPDSCGPLHFCNGTYCAEPICGDVHP